MFCEKCGTEIAASARFCEYCGSPIAATLDKLSQAPAVQESSNPAGISPRFEGQAKSSQAPAVQEATSLNEAQCYYCTKLIPTGALNCPSCGKERKELHDLRLKARNFAIGSIGFGFAFGLVFIGTIADRWSTLFGGIDAVEMINDPVFWLSLSLVVIGELGIRFRIRRCQRRYAELSGGKKMADWLVRDKRG